MADIGDGARLGDKGAGEGRPSPAETAARGVRMLERLIAGSELAEIAADEGLSPRRARGSWPRPSPSAGMTRSGQPAIFWRP